MFYVYRLIDPRNDLPFYIGKGKGDRLAAHERDARNGLISDKCDRIREIWDAGFAVVRETVRYFSNEQDAFAFERSLIVEIGIDNLTNVIGGSFGGSKVEGIPDRVARPLAAIVRKLSRCDHVNLFGIDVTDGIYRIIIDNIKKFGVDQMRAAMVRFDADLELMRLRTAN